MYALTKGMTLGTSAPATDTMHSRLSISHAIPAILRHTPAVSMARLSRGAGDCCMRGERGLPAIPV